MEKYTQQGKKFTFMCLVLSCATIMILLSWTSFLFIYDIVEPLNGTHRLECPFVAEYFIDEEVYYYHILLHMYTIFLVGLAVVIATETFYTICIQHACGLFHIVGYRFERIFNQSTLSSISLTEKNVKFDDCISRAIKSHQNAIAASVRILNAVVRVINIVCYLFGIFYCGQKLIDYSTNISVKAYAIPWFLESSKIHTTLIIILQRSVKESTLVVGGLYPMSYELLEMVN
ncbi:hypothetical protein M0802_006256 [Mischocyttarus mexicanus]|nr:hypothetical protein M0802_006256 [Mischocyttarus mexicanus]